MRRLALITGAGGGLGGACVERLGRIGFSVIASDIRSLPTDQTIDFVQMDVSDEASVAAAFDNVEDRFGAISVLVCCAGGTTVTRSHQPSIAETSLADWMKTEALNSRGTFLCVREMLRRRAARPVENGRIVLTSSAAGQRPAVAAGAAYSASKAAVIGFARTAALEAAKLGMTLNVIAPGGFDTDAYHITTDETQRKGQVEGIPMGRLGRPAEFAALVQYLVSEDAAYLTGATIDMNGGSRMA